MEEKDIYILEPEPWERQLNETSRAWEAFTVYRDMGASRSIVKVSRELGKNRVTLEEWSTKYDWVKRCAAWDAEKDRVARETQIKDIIEMRQRHAAIAKKMMDTADHALEHIRPDEVSTNEIARLVEIASKLERIARGDAGEVIEERDGGEAISAVQIYIPDNNRGRDKDTFDDLEVEHEPESN